MRKKHYALATALGLCFGIAHAAPQITFTDLYTDVNGPGAYNRPPGSFINLDVIGTTAFDPGSVNVVATYSLDPAIQVSLDYTPAQGAISFYSYLAFISDMSLTGAWTVVATDQSGSTTVSLQAISNPQILPFVDNLRVTQSGTTPSISWDLPDLSGFDVDLVRLRVGHAASNATIFQINLPTISTTSFTMPSGVLQVGESYNFRVMLTDLDATGVENRSNTYTGNVTLVPEPSQYALLSLGLLALWSSTRRSKSRSATA